MERGQVKWFKADKGVGFIEPDVGGRQVFVDSKHIIGAKSLREGQYVEYRVEQALKGPEAREVRILAG